MSEDRYMLHLHTAEPLILQPNIQKVKVALTKMKNKKAPGIDVLSSDSLTEEKEIIIDYQCGFRKPRLPFIKFWLCGESQKH